MQDVAEFDVVIVGTGFASTFFLKKLLESKTIKRVLVLERGSRHSYAWQVENIRNNNLEIPRPHRETGLPGKWWNYTIGFGGGSNCWWTNAMRLHPSEFELQSRYGVGIDWPISYQDLEPYYCDAEDDMLVSGDNSSSIMFPRSRPFPQPRHRYSEVGSALKAAYPDETFAMPTTRGRVANDRRGVCCAVGNCTFCPNQAKFTIVEEMGHLFEDPRVTLELEAEVLAVETSAGLASGVIYRISGQEKQARAGFIALGANGIFNPFILLKSGLTDGPVGRGIVEQIPINLTIDFTHAKTQGFSSYIGAVNHSFVDGPQRAHGAGGFVEIKNFFQARPNRDKWNNQASAVFLLGDLRNEENRVIVDPDAPDHPMVVFKDWSPYAYAGVDYVRSRLHEFFAPLGIDRIEGNFGKAGTHSHIEGTTVMGLDPRTSVIDGDLLHHKVRNLAVLGSGAFPTSPGSNPTLTIAALSLRSASRTVLGHS